MIDLKGTTVVVSGFPRSGTSMMMRVLDKAGFEVLTSERHRQAVNEAEPDGVLELEGVNEELAAHPREWTANKAIKLVAPYIGFLPLDRPLKVIFMLRPIPEIVVSLLAQRSIWEQDPWSTISAARKYLEVKNVPTHFVHYHEMMQYPKTIISGVRDFLEVDFDISEAVKGVYADPRKLMKRDEKKIINASKDAFFKSREDILVLNDGVAEVEYVSGSDPNA